MSLKELDYNGPKNNQHNYRANKWAIDTGFEFQSINSAPVGPMPTTNLLSGVYSGNIDTTLNWNSFPLIIPLNITLMWQKENRKVTISIPPFNIGAAPGMADHLVTPAGAIPVELLGPLPLFPGTSGIIFQDRPGLAAGNKIWSIEILPNGQIRLAFAYAYEPGAVCGSTQWSNFDYLI